MQDCVNSRLPSACGPGAAPCCADAADPKAVNRRTKETARRTIQRSSNAGFPLLAMSLALFADKVHRLFGAASSIGADAALLDQLAPARHLYGHLLAHFLRCRGRGDVAAFGKPLLNIRQCQRAPHLDIDAIDDRPRRSARQGESEP